VTYVFRQSWLFGLRRETIRIHRDRIDHAKPGIVARTRTVTVRFEHIAEIVLDRRMLWSSLSVETTGGGGFTIHGLRRLHGDLAKRELERGIAEMHAAESLADALDRLGRLKTEGLLTEQEFVAAKGAVFRRAA
jgi:hypothetical protein